MIPWPIKHAQTKARWKDGWWRHRKTSKKDQRTPEQNKEQYKKELEEPFKDKVKVDD